MKKGDGSLLRYEFCCVQVERVTGQTRQRDGERVGGRRDELLDRDEKEVDGVGHAEGDDVNELKCN